MNTIRPSNLGRGAAAVAMLLLMLSSQIGSAGSAKLETQTTQQPVPQPPPSTPPVVPPSNSAPGQLSYTNTWNRTGQQPICLQTHALVSSNTLKPEAQSWTITSSVPSLLPGNGAPSGQSVSYTYTAYANESFIVSDDHGNDLYWKGVTGFPAGTTTIRLYGNTTEALQVYTVGPAAHPSANFTVAYRLMQTSNGCEPLGASVTIQGTVSWPGSSGTLRIAFHGQQVSSNATQVSFGGRGGLQIVFNWSDSMKRNPATFQGQTGTVSWSVGDSFKIDPSLVGTSNSQLALNWGDQRKLWHTVESNGTTEYWAFYFDGTNIAKSWSATGITWHSSELTSGDGATNGSAFSSWMEHSGGVYTLYYALADPSAGGFVLGTVDLGDNGATNVVSQTQFSTQWSGDSNPCVYGTPTDVIVGVATSSAGSYQLEIYHIGASSMKVLSNAAYSTGLQRDGCIVLGLTSGYALLYAAAGAASPVMVITSANGNGWSAATATPTTAPITMSSAVAMGNTLDFATVTGAGEVYWNSVYPCTTTSTPLTLASSSGGISYDNVVLSTNSRSGGASIAATYHTIGGVWSRSSDDGGNTWTPPQEVADGSTGIIASGSLQADYDYVGQNAPIVATTDVAWVTGTTRPFAIWFPAFPVEVPSAASTSDPWAKSGYSPYESYFSQLDEYVSPGNGLLGVSQTDLSLPGRSPALTVTRVYSQPSDFNGDSDAKVPYQYDSYTLSDLGLGWELSYPWIGGTAADPTFLHPGDGSSIPIQFNSSNIMEYHGATDFVLYKNANSTYTLYTADGTRYNFAGLKLSTIVSPDSPSDKLTFSYNVTPGYITQIQDAEGRTVSFGYNANNTLASVVSGSETWRYTYEGSDLASVTDPLGRVTRFTYTSYNPWLIYEIAYPTGAATFYDYDTGLVAPYVSTYVVVNQTEYSSGSLHILVRSNQYAFNMVDGSMVSTTVDYRNSTDAAQGATVFDFRVIDGKYVQLESQRDAAGSLMGSVETDFDQQGRENQTIVYSAQGAKLAYSVTHYDAWGNVNFTQDYDGHATYYAYAGTKDQYQFGNGKTGLLQDFYANSTIDSHIHTDLLGTGTFQNPALQSTAVETFYLYDNNEVLKENQLYIPPSGLTTWLTTSYTYDALANLQTMTDPLHHETCYSYSSSYQSAYLTSETSSGSSNCYAAPDVTVSYTYNFATGTLASQTDGEGNTTSYTYDSLGRLTSETYPAVNGVAGKTSYSYDDANNTVTETDQTGNITKSYYDGLGRLTKVETYLSPSSPYSAEYYSYNWLNEALTDTAPNGATTSYTYDSLGRQTGVAYPDGSRETSAYNDTTNTQTITDGDGHVTQDVYDFMQNLVAVREYWSGSGYNATTYAYDGLGNLVKVVGPDANQVTQYTYDDLNRLVETTYPDGTTQRATYDSAGNLLSSTDQEGRVTTYSYDFLYRLSAVNYPDGTVTSYTYDKDGNQLTVTNSVDEVKYSYDALNRVVSETDVVGGTPYTVSYGYDLAGDAQSVTYPDGTKVSYSFDALGRTTKAASGPTTYATVAYNPDGTVSAMTYGNGEVTSYSYDSMSRPKSITTAQGSNQLLSLSYKYDGAGNVVSINSESFGYDALDRLNGATGPWGAATYSYDPAGNLVQKQNSSSPTTRYTYNSMDELVRSSTAGGATTYSYNGDGDLVVKNDGTNIWTYVYNTQDQMTKVLENGVVVQQNYYDGEGRRVEQTTGTTTMLYLYVGLNALYEKNLQTGAATKHVYADGEQIASIATAGTFFLAADELGSTRLVTSGSSQVFSSDYVPYGVEHGASGSEEYMYTGMLYDAATGLYYDNARFYDPSTGKFLTADPVGGGKSDPQSLNAYAYARDNPLAIVDPSGLSWKPLTVLLGVAVAGLIAIDAAQGGFDVLTDGITVEAISELVGSATVVGASAVGLPVVLGGTEDIGPDALAAATSSWTDRWDSGDAGEVYLQGIVQRVGLNTERGWYMNSETGELAKLSGVQTGWVQLDLYDFEHGWAFESKVGYRGYTDYEDDQARAQAALVKRGFLNGVSWFSLPNDEGSTGFSQHLWRDTLLPRGIISGFWTDGVGMTFYKWPY